MTGGVVRGRGTVPDDDHAHAAAVAAVGASPAVLHRLLAGMTPLEAWRKLVEGTHPADPERHHQRRAAAHPPASVAAACARCGAQVLLPGDQGYPAFLDQRQQPAVLFSMGHGGDAGDLLRVAVVGTRAPSAAGSRAAWRLGRELAEAGVVVVSGLAHGIDTAAHRGALAAGGARVVGVLGAAPDAPVGPDSADLRRRVADGGLLLTEVPPGAPGARWMFAVRNRLMAAAAHAVVVVESHVRGGSMHTVDAARRLDVPVLVSAPVDGMAAADGTRALVRSGAALPVAGSADVVAAACASAARGATARGTVAASAGFGTQGHLPLGLEVGARSPGMSGSATRSSGPLLGGPVIDLAGSAEVVLRALRPVPADVAVVANRAGIAIGATAVALHALQRAGLAAEEHGWWSLA